MFFDIANEMKLDLNDVRILFEKAKNIGVAKDCFNDQFFIDSSWEHACKGNYKMAYKRACQIFDYQERTLAVYSVEEFESGVKNDNI